MLGARFIIWPVPTHRLVRSSVVFCLAALYLVLAVGVPLGVPGPSSSERFPCENCSCGCSTAEQCWQNCCCFSPAERLAWAEREGVTPPVSVAVKTKAAQTKAAQAEVAQNKLAKTKSESAGCATGGCCCASKVEPKSGDRSRVAGWRALACQGKSLGWLAATPTLVLATSQRAVVVLSFPSYTLAIYSETAIGQIESPPVPPPRSSMCV